MEVYVQLLYQRKYDFWKEADILSSYGEKISGRHFLSFRHSADVLDHCVIDKNSTQLEMPASEYNVFDPKRLLRREFTHDPSYFQQNRGFAVTAEILCYIFLNLPLPFPRRLRNENIIYTKCKGLQNTAKLNRNCWEEINTKSDGRLIVSRVFVSADVV